MNRVKLSHTARTRGALFCALLFSAVVALPLSAQADESYRFKAATVAPEGTPWASLFNRFRRNIRRASEGKLRARIFLGGVKGDERSIMRQVVAGTLQMGGSAFVIPVLDLQRA